jgi:aldehyde dehydrogenase (NAD(P)+)
MTTQTVPASSGATAAQGRVSTRQELDTMVARLRERAATFAGLSLGDRIALALSMQTGYLRIAKASVEAACAAKGITPGTPPEGEEWATGPWCVVRQLRLLMESLRSIERTGTTPIGPLGRTVDGRLTVRVFPAGRVDSVLFSGITAEVHLEAGWEEGRVDDSRARFYRHRIHDGRVALVLGAGNLAGIGPMDVLTKMLNEGMVCLLKLNPVNAYLAPFMENAFGEAVRRGFLAVAYGGAEEGAYLAHHEDVDEVHLTGSDRTYESLVWGPPGPERESRKARHAPLLRKPVTAELGNVSPILIVPGPYSDRDLAFQAESIAGSMTHNASFNCNAGKVLISPGGWPARQVLLGAVEQSLAKALLRKAYYPGAAERWAALTRDRSGLKTIGQADPGQLPWTLITNVDAGNPAEPAFGSEPFCPVLLETAVGSSDPIDYLDRAVSFANNRLWGNLSATLVVHPKTLKDPSLAAAVEQAIARLKYGAVAVNSWSGFLFVYASPPWGAHPSSTATDIQSGTGWVHNTAMLEGIEKVVLRHPLTIVPKPASFPSHRTAHTLLRRLTWLDQRASWKRVPGVIAAAMRG